ncbi:MAG: hypothetical protein ABSE95_17235 [Thermodesulfobacteriota bacterium]|jgi:hypothetical protein
MTVPLPEGELLRKAVQWISEQRELVSRPSLSELIDKAGERFNLSPKDSEFLLNFFTAAQKQAE